MSDSKLTKIPVPPALLWLALGVSVGALGMRLADRPTPAKSAEPPFQPVRIVAEAPKPKAPVVKPVNPVGEVDVLPEEPQFRNVDFPLTGRLGVTPLPEAPVPADPVVVKSEPLPPPKRKPSSLDKILAQGLPEPPKPASPVVVVPAEPPKLTIDQRMGQFAEFVRSELKGTANVDAIEATVEVTLRTEQRSRAQSKAAELGGRRISASVPGEDELRTAKSRVEALQSLRDELLKSYPADSRPVREAESDLMQATKALETAQANVDSGTTILVFRF